MLSTLVVIALYGKLCFANSYLHDFNEFEHVGVATVNPEKLDTALHFTKICEEGMESLQTETPEEVCAARCVIAPYFCHSFLLTYVEKTLNCYHFGHSAQAVAFDLRKLDDPVHHLRSLYQEEGEIHWDYQLRSLYEVNNRKGDFVTAVYKSSLIFYVNRIGVWISWHQQELCKSLNYKQTAICDNFIMLSGNAAERSEKDFGPRSSSALTQASLSHNLNRKSLISALKSWTLPDPKSTTYFDQLALIFLKLYGPKDSYAYQSDLYYFAIQRHDTGEPTRVLAVSFGSGHYVTITAGESHDEIAYISADGKSDQATKRIDEACLIYCQQTDRLLQLEKGTTVIRSPIKKSSPSFGDLSCPQRTAALLVVAHVTSAMGYRQHVVLGSHLPIRTVYRMMTFVLSWVYKVRQSDLGSENLLGSRMLKSIPWTLAGESLVDVITES